MSIINESEAIKADVKVIKEKLKSMTKPVSKKAPRDEEEDYDE